MILRVWKGLHYN